MSGDSFEPKPKRMLSDKEEIARKALERHERDKARQIELRLQQRRDMLLVSLADSLRIKRSLTKQINDTSDDEVRNALRRRINEIDERVNGTKGELQSAGVADTVAYFNKKHTDTLAVVLKNFPTVQDDVLVSLLKKAVNLDIHIFPQILDKTPIWYASNTRR